MSLVLIWAAAEGSNGFSIDGNTIGFGGAGTILAIMFIRFLRESARQEKRVDSVNEKRIKAAEDETERVRTESRAEVERVRAEAKAEVDKAHSETQEEERRCAQTKKFYLERIQHLEILLYGEARTTATDPIGDIGTDEPMM